MVVTGYHILFFSQAVTNPYVAHVKVVPSGVKLPNNTYYPFAVMYGNLWVLLIYVGPMDYF
jgi:hypothetical protein